MNKLKLFGKYSAAITFLAFEFFALIAFNYSGSFVLFGSLSLGLCVLLILFNIGEIKVNGLSNVALFFIPLFLFTLLTTFGTYNIAHTKVNDFSWAETVFIPLGLLSMAFNGYMLSIDKHFKIKTFIIVVFSALAAYVLINFIYNLISFGAFYPVIYKGYYMYYSGIKGNVAVNEMAYTLEGFKFIEVKMAHYVLYPLLLLSSSVMLLYVSPKKEKGYFFTYLAFTLLAILSLVLIPSKLSLGGIAVAAVLVLIIYLGKRYIKSRAIFKYALYASVFLFAAFYVFYVVVVYTGKNESFTGILARITTTNKYSISINPILYNLFSGEKFLGFATNTYPPPMPGMKPDIKEVYLSGSFLFDSLMTSGVIGALAIFGFIFLGFKSFKKYFHSHVDEFRYQAVLLLFAILFIGYSALFNSTDYAIYYKLYKPLYLTAPFMVLMFIFSYVICKSHPAIVSEKVNVVEEVIENA